MKYRLSLIVVLLALGFMAHTGAALAQDDDPLAARKAECLSRLGDQVAPDQEAWLSSFEDDGTWSGLYKISDVIVEDGTLTISYDRSSQYQGAPVGEMVLDSETLEGNLVIQDHPTNASNPMFLEFDEDSGFFLGEYRWNFAGVHQNVICMSLSEAHVDTILSGADEAAPAETVPAATPASTGTVNLVMTDMSETAFGSFVEFEGFIEVADGQLAALALLADDDALVGVNVVGFYSGPVSDGGSCEPTAGVWQYAQTLSAPAELVDLLDDVDQYEKVVGGTGCLYETDSGGYAGVFGDVEVTLSPRVG